MKKARRVLVVEDDREITDLIALHFSDMGLETDRAEDGTTGLEMVESHSYALVVLDIMLPGLDGLELCRRIRSQSSYTPILMLTAKSEELDKVVGLEVGADDYVTKPFSVRELNARVRALLRRSAKLGAPAEGTGETGTERPAPPLEFGRLVVDPAKRGVFVDGARVELTTKEFDLLLTLCRHPGQAFNRGQLLELVWGYNFDGYSHTVNSHINRLRAKIEEDSSKPKFIETVWGYGYRFSDSGGSE
jgi:DNA-binding response OmpR family regulator